MSYSSNMNDFPDSKNITMSKSNTFESHNLADSIPPPYKKVISPRGNGYAQKKNILDLPSPGKT